MEPLAEPLRQPLRARQQPLQGLTHHQQSPRGEQAALPPERSRLIFAIINMFNNAYELHIVIALLIIIIILTSIMLVWSV